MRGTRRDAERELARLVVEVDEGRYAPAAPMSFGELLDRWLAVKKLSVEPSTLKSYGWVSARYLRPALGERKVAAVRPLGRATAIDDTQHDHRRQSDQQLAHARRVHFHRGSPDLDGFDTIKFSGPLLRVADPQTLLISFFRSA